ncbi:MAG: type II toxin-antitoxin system RelE/ParE family toxin [Patescibacteria group bacterium]|nr:type II toxin-antitoxin system RelE/ParE family toxin [Patescibacteria group bacterium]MDE1940835.1 type II toxin-antitoxin system RelE/ParE family toxin [Patescibacteria group bacterium]MDE1966745.1 type II toxin-antitoxin system RelE/ParE family toxin [Patescibacteria group bacterium]
MKIDYHPSVLPRDISGIMMEDRKKIKLSIDNKLTSHPEVFGIKLRGTLKDFWKLRVGDYRVIFKPERERVYVLAIGNRKDVYKIAERRLIGPRI